MRSDPAGYVAMVLHSHLPFVLGHGAWPGSEWLPETTVACYLPLLEAVEGLAAEGRSPHLTIDVSPVLMEQMAAPAYKTAIDQYLRGQIDAAVAHRGEFARDGNEHFVALARHWEQYYRDRLAQFDHLDGDLIGALRRLYERGHIVLITCAATHGYLPLLGRDESVDLQLRVAVAAHERHFGHRPAGIWLPECAYRPRYEWTPPIETVHEMGRVLRRGLEEMMAEHGLRYFLTDASLVRGGGVPSVYRDVLLAVRSLGGPERPLFHPERLPFEPYTVVSRGGTGSAVAFVRDPGTALLVWSRDAGYPGNEWYLEFHKKHFPGGLRYWRVTHPKSDLADKLPYDPSRADERAGIDAEHFVGLLARVLGDFRRQTGRPGIVCSLHDTELFGHYWFEGARWLREVYRRLDRTQLLATDCQAYLESTPAPQTLSLLEGSWGEGGDHRTWLNRDTEWTWEILYRSEEDFWGLARNVPAGAAPARRVLAQLARELLLLQSSDWQFLISTWAARHYAQIRFTEHHANFTRLAQTLRGLMAGRPPNADEETFLHEREQQNFVFPDVATHVEAACRAAGA